MNGAHSTLPTKRVQMVGKSYVNNIGQRIWVIKEPHHIVTSTSYSQNCHLPIHSLDGSLGR